MICKYCGKETPEESAFCMECGKKFEIVEGNEVQTNNLKTENVSDEKSNEIGKREKTLELPLSIIILLWVIGIGVVYLSIAQFRQSNTIVGIESSNRVLVVDVEIEDEQSSDNTQIKNALSNGGEIIININKDYIPQSLRYDINDYAAMDSSNYYYTRGALLNYIASKGWTLVESDYLHGRYYFVR